MKNLPQEIPVQIKQIAEKAIRLQEKDTWRVNEPLGALIDPNGEKPHFHCFAGYSNNNGTVSIQGQYLTYDGYVRMNVIMRVLLCQLGPLSRKDDGSIASIGWQPVATQQEIERFLDRAWSLKVRNLIAPVVL